MYRDLSARPETLLLREDCFLRRRPEIYLLYLIQVPMAIQWHRAITRVRDLQRL